MKALLDADRRARLAARTEFERPLALEAGAGTGKTATLVARVAVWLTGPGFERARRELSARGLPHDDARCAARALEGVLAITFTEKAAAEMDQRVRAALAELEHGREPRGLEGLVSDDAARRALELRRALDRPLARTIHAFAQELLREHPFAAGVHPGFQIDADSERRAEAVRRALRAELAGALARTPDPDWLTLAEGGTTPRQIEACVLALCAGGARASDLERDPCARATVEPRVEALFDAAQRLCEHAAAARSSLKKNASVSFAALDAALATAALNAPAAYDTATLELWFQTLRQLWPASSAERVKKWGKDDLNVGEAKGLGEARASFVARAQTLSVELEALLDFEPRGLQAARHVALRVLSAAQADLARQGWLGFDDLLESARALLERDGLVAARLRARTTQLFVDEFQDTDPAQCALVRTLAFGPAPRPGLFLVGDPKQSIYGWRRADLSAYDAFLDELRAAGGEVHVLHVNFRSTPRILAEVERVLEPRMHAERGVQPRFEPLVAHDPERVAREARVEHWVAWELAPEAEARGAKTRAERASALEAAAVAADLARLVRAGIPPEQCAVLARSAVALEPVLEALRAAGIAYEASGDRSFYRRRETQDAVALLCAVLDPLDALSLAAWLRSPWVGVPDAALEPLWAAGLPEHSARWSALDAAAQVEIERLGEVAARVTGQDVPGFERVRGFESALRHALEALATLRASLNRDPADVFVEQLRALLLCEATSAARHLGAWRAANLERFFARVRAALDQAGGDRAQLLGFLRRALDEARDADEAPPRSSSRRGVQVMTFHKAKGLDFEQVWVVGLHRKSQLAREPENRVLRSTDSRCEFRLCAQATLGYAALRARESVRERAEAVRLLYVALTRAKNGLVLSGAWPAEARAVDDGRAATLMDLLAASSEPDFFNVLDQAAESNDASFPWHGRLVRFAARASVEPVGAQPRDQAQASAEIELHRQAAWRASARLSELEPAATQRMLRALGRAASAAMAAPFGTALFDIARVDTVPLATAPLDTPPAALSSTTPRLTDQAHSREAARAMGTALHRALERLELEPADANDAGLERALLRALEALQLESDAGAEASALLTRFAHSRLGARLVALLPRLVAREAPLVLAPRAGDAVLGYVAGAIDLVYRDPADDTLVIVDYKTDRLAEGAGPAEFALHARGYHSALADYAHALRAALDLTRLPRCELWYLRHDVLHVVSAAELETAGF